MKPRFLAVLFICLFFVQAGWVQQVCGNQQTVSDIGKEKTFPIYKIGSHIFTKAKLNGDEKYWVIDTGAGSTVIDLQYAKGNKLPELGKSKAMGVNGPVEISIYNIPKLVINDYVIENVSVIGFDVYGLFKKKYNIEVAGILGFNILSKYVVKVDYAGMKMALFDPSAFKYLGSGNKIDFQLYNNIVMVPLKVDNKYEGLFALDTGASTSALNYPYAVKNKITEMDGPDFMVFGAQGGFVLKQVRFPVIEFGGYTLNNVVMSFPVEKTAGILGTDAFSGNIGINILQNFTLYIDYLNKVLYLEKSANFNREFPFDKSGMQLEAKKDNLYEIIYISNNSAAQKSGLKVGDVVLSINGKSPAEIGSIDEIYSIFKDQDGTKIELKIKRDSKEAVILLILMDPFKK